MSSLPCYILGLESNFRGDRLIASLKEIGIDANIHFGIDATQSRDYLAKSTDQAASRLLQKRELGMTEVACALGHQGIWQKIAEGESDWALVFEDDAYLVENLFLVVPTLSDFSGPTIIQLNRSIHVDKSIFLNERIEIKNFPHAVEAPYFVKKLNFSSGAYGYLMNKAAATVAINASRGRKVINILDWPYLWRHKVAFWEPSIDLVRHQGESIIDIDRAAIMNEMKERKQNYRSGPYRALAFTLNLLGVQAWRFHRLGYPGRLVYFNNVVMPFKRRFILLKNRISSKSKP